MSQEHPSSPSPDIAVPRYISVKGARALCLGCLHSAVGIEFLSVAGPGTAVQAILSAVMAGHEVAIVPEGGRHEATRLSTYTRNNGFRAMVRKLPSGLTHGIAVTKRCLPEGNGKTFVLLVKGTDPETAAAALLNMLDRKTDVPLHPAWAARLWQAAAKKGWVTPLDGFGPYSGWEADVDEEALKKMIGAAIKKRTLTI